MAATVETADLLFVGSGRWVAGLDRFSGHPVWRQKLPRLFGGLITLALRGDELYVGRGGYVYCMDARTGQTLWERGVGSPGNTVMMALAGGTSDQGGAAAAHEAASAASTAATAS